MVDIERLLGKFEEFMTTTKESLAQNREDHLRLMKTVDDLTAIRWKFTGMATAAALFGAIIGRFI